ncbi:MAG: TonB-dependent receptor [Acidobacteria bacterium]|nr:TonB-dependent receptor [Acidobacteriota bacterium]
MSFLVVSDLGAASGVLRGRVTDPNHRGVPRAQVRIEPGGRLTITGDNGEFEVSGLPAGEYTLTAEERNFEPVTVSVLRVEAGGVASATLGVVQLKATHMQVDVIGTNPEAALQEIPGSAYLVEYQDLAASRPADANEVLRQAPGVHVREDSGPVGMRLNIGIRGLNPDRSRTLLVLEDGLPVALAPYGEPEMYYSPPIDRMRRIEILKGSGSILHGPQTIGGVLNFITPDPPPRQEGTLDLTGGQYGLFTGQASYGGSRDGTGWYLSALRKQGDGWRDFRFGIQDLIAKFNFTLSERNRLGVKLGFYDENSNSTYLGLTEAMYRADPAQNPVSDDLLRVRRYSASLTEQFFPIPRAVLATTLFAYTTTRNWRRQDFSRGAGDALYLRDSSGNNNREFDVAGAESRLSLEHSLFGLRQRLDTGVRYVYEQHRDRRIDGATRTLLSGVLREDEVRDGKAVSGFVQNRIFFSSRLVVSPGLRIETYEYTRHILRQPVNGTPSDANIRRGDSVWKPIPGLGVSYLAASPLTLFAGVHRGFAPPRIKDAITRAGVSLQLDAELSWNYEAGARFHLVRGLRAEGTWFATDFQNQIVPAAVSGGATTTLVNGGRTLHRGVELLLSATRKGLYVDVRHTWIPTARFSSGVNEGFRLPYAPENAFGVRAGWRHRSGFALHIDGTRAGRQFTDNRQTVPGSADGTVGLLDGYWVWNASAGHEFQRERVTVSPFVTTKNLADERYISSRAPQGIQPGMFRQVTGGVKLRF